jgi:beta-lactamase regulating signal transducer with metallopeptidase domain
MALAGIALLAAAAVAIIASLVSLSSALALPAGSRWLDRLAPAAQARVLLAAALLPMLAAVTLVGIAMAPAMGLIADHCLSFEALHAHPHLCAQHHVVAVPAISVVALTLYLVARLAIAMASLALRSLQAHRTVRALDRVSVEETRGVRTIRMDEPQAFVLGLLSPTIYLSDALARADGGAWVQIALDHERAHVARRDPLLKAIASVGFAFHLPGVASWLAHRLVRAQEMAADEASAEQNGSRAKVAEALVRLARVRASVPAGAITFGSTDLEARVQSLLAQKGPNHPSARLMLAAALAVAAVTALNADLVHHAVEMILGVVH